MTYLLLYCPPIYKISGGLNNFMMFFNICKSLKIKIKYCPLLDNIESLNFNSPFKNIPFENINQDDMYGYFNKQDSQYIDKNDIVTKEILCKKNNVIIYSEDVIGNPAKQEFVVRWLHYFPIQKAVSKYNFNNDLIYFFSDYIINFYKHLCKNIGIYDLLTPNIKEINICRIFKFDKNDYLGLDINRVNIKNMHLNKCFSLRKFFPPSSFKNFNINNYKKNLNPLILNDIKRFYKNKLFNLKREIIYAETKNKTNIFLSISAKKNIYEKKSDLLNLINKGICYDLIINYWKENFLRNGFEEIGWKHSPIEYINLFKNKTYFVTLDPFTFISIISTLTGCISIIKKIDGLEFEDWLKGDPFNKYGIAYGIENIEHAINTRHLLLSHIEKLFNENEENVIKMIKNIEKKFSVCLN